MPTVGVETAVVDCGRILLTKREDFEIWCLPGGAIEPGESAAQTAVREVLEETGVEVEVTGLVGIYSRPRWNQGGDHDILFAATPVGGALKPQASEVIDLGYFGADALPNPLLEWHRQRIFDALNGAIGLARLQDTVWPFDRDLSRRELYALRDQSGQPRQQVFLQFLQDYDPALDILETGSDGNS